MSIMHLVPWDTLKGLAASVEPVQGAVITAFLTEAHKQTCAEVEAAKKCLAHYGYKVIETQHHEYQELE